MTTVRSSRASKRTALILLAPMALAFGARASAHRLDEFLQAARIGVERDRVQLEMNLTPGTAVADGVIREIDADGNRALSPEEQQAYATQVLSTLALHIDQTPPLHLELAATNFPDIAALRRGDAAISIRSAVVVPSLTAGTHRIFFRNQNPTANSVYLANALVPEGDDVAVTGQQRDGDQRELTIDFVVSGAPVASSRGWVWIGLAGALAFCVSLARRTR
jgi:hypothetical protein